MESASSAPPRLLNKKLRHPRTIAKENKQMTGTRDSPPLSIVPPQNSKTIPNRLVRSRNRFSPHACQLR